MTERILVGYIHRCLACNRPLNGAECERTYPNSKELIGLCNSCRNASEDDRSENQHMLPSATEGLTQSKYIDSHSRYFYEYFDN